MGSHEDRVEGENCLCQPAGHASFDASQDKLALWAGCGVNVMAQSFPCQTAGRQQWSQHCEGLQRQRGCARNFTAVT